MSEKCPKTVRELPECCLRVVSGIGYTKLAYAQLSLSINTAHFPHFHFPPNPIQSNPIDIAIDITNFILTFHARFSLILIYDSFLPTLCERCVKSLFQAAFTALGKVRKKRKRRRRTKFAINPKFASSSLFLLFLLRFMARGMQTISCCNGKQQGGGKLGHSSRRKEKHQHKRQQ